MKKVAIIILAVILVLLPSIAALILHLIPETSISNPINISGTFSDGELVDYEFNRNKNVFLASFFDSIYENSTLTDVSADNIDYDKSFSVQIVKKNDQTSLTLYLSVDKNCYFSDSNGVYLINTEHSNTLLNSEYAVSVYEHLYTPALLTFSNDTVTPSSTNFKYIVKDGSDIERTDISTTDDTITYYSSNTSYFKFSVEPTYGTVTAYYDDNVLSKPLYEFNPSVLPQNSLIRYEIDVTWVKNSKSNVIGNAKYEFIVDYSPAPSFSIERKSVTAGEFIVVKADNIIDTEKIQCSFSAGLDSQPKFFKSGDSHYALIPLDVSLKAGSYKLTLSCGETKSSAYISVSKADQSQSSNVYEIDTPLTDEAISNMKELISTIGEKYSDEIYADGEFINYSEKYEDDFTLMLPFGRVRAFSEGPSFEMVGIEYLSYSVIDVPAINSGIVCATGENGVLGKYIVVDHGYGLKSWYCNISETSLTVGDLISKGEAIAKTGSSAFYQKNGFYLITTVLGTPVSPYTLFEKNIGLPD